MEDFICPDCGKVIGIYKGKGHVDLLLATHWRLKVARLHVKVCGDVNIIVIPYEFNPEEYLIEPKI